MDWFNTYKRSVKPFIRYLRAFGCVAYVHLKGTRVGLKKPGKSQKMNPRAVKGYLVGYESTNIYRIWFPQRGEVRPEKNVAFNELVFFDPKDLGPNAPHMPLRSVKRP